MATWKFEGIDNYIEDLKKLVSMSDKHAKRALYEGAGAAADIFKRVINDLPVDDDKGKKDMRRGLRSAQKEGLQRSFGISGMRHDGTEINVKLGFDGYNTIKTKTWPNGQPNAMIARTIDSGNSFTPATHFISKATKQAKPIAEKAMQFRLENDIKQTMN